MQVFDDISSTAFVLLEQPVGISFASLPSFSLHRNSMNIRVQSLLGLPLDGRLGVTWVALITFFLALVSVLVFVVYSLYLHPLAKYPGPLLAKFTNARSAYYAWTGDLHLDMFRCHQRYGPYVRYSPNRLLLNTPKALKGGLPHVHGYSKNIEKSREYMAMVHRVPSTFTLRDKKEHAWKRRILSQGFSESAIRSFEPHLLTHIAKFCSTVCPTGGKEVPTGERPWSAPLNMSAWCDYLFFDLITDVVFGASYDLLGSTENRYITKAIEDSNKRVSVIIQAPEVTIRRMDKKLFPVAVTARNVFLKFIKKLVADRMQAKERTDVFSILLSAKDPETQKQLNNHEIVAESTTMLVAGSDTSSTLMASMFFYLSRHPAVLAKVTHEVRTRFLSRQDIRVGAALSSCRYLRACIDECLRISPPVGAALLRDVVRGGATVDGHFIPEGVTVGIGMYSLHHTDTYFPQPFDFIPDRWLSIEDGAGGGIKRSCNVDAYAPFSMGTRSCIGKALALAEVMLAMATVCWSLEFRIAEGLEGEGAGHPKGVLGRTNRDEFQLYDHITSAKYGPMIQFRTRIEEPLPN